MFNFIWVEKKKGQERKTKNPKTHVPVLYVAVFGIAFGDALKPVSSAALGGRELILLIALLIISNY